MQRFVFTDISRTSRPVILAPEATHGVQAKITKENRNLIFIQFEFIETIVEGEGEVQLIKIDKKFMNSSKIILS